MNSFQSQTIHGTRQRAFSLLEMLVAFSILSIALGILLNIFSNGAQTAVAAEEYTSAVQVAESLMSRIGTEYSIKPGQTQGSLNNKYDWQITIAPFDFTMKNFESDKVPVLLFMVTVNVSWGDGGFVNGLREVELTTLKMTAKRL